MLKHGKMYYIGDAILGTGCTIGIVPSMMLAIYFIDGRSFKLGLTFLLFGIAAILTLVGIYLIFRAESQEEPRHCPRCGNAMVNVIRTRRDQIPTYFCECDKCLLRSKYSKRRSGAILDWNRTKDAL